MTDIVTVYVEDSGSRRDTKSLGGWSNVSKDQK